MAFQILSASSKTCKKYHVGRRVVIFKINDLPNGETNPEEWVKNGLKEIVAHVVQDVRPEDKVGFSFASEGFTKGEAHVPLKVASKVTFNDVWGLLGKIYQSNAEAVHSETFRVTMTHVRQPRGQGRQTRHRYNTFEEECNKRRGIVVINNNDRLCLPRALVVAMAYLMNVPYLKQIRQNVGKRQDQEAQKLIADTGIEIPEGGAGYEELQQFQRYLHDFKISVYKYGTNGTDLLFEGPDASQKINLLFHNNHYNVITSLTAAFSCSYYCEKCYTPYNNKNTHRCHGSCPC